MNKVTMKTLITSITPILIVILMGASNSFATEVNCKIGNQLNLKPGHELTIRMTNTDGLGNYGSASFGVCGAASNIHFNIPDGVTQVKFQLFHNGGRISSRYFDNEIHKIEFLKSHPEAYITRMVDSQRDIFMTKQKYPCVDFPVNP